MTALRREVWNAGMPGQRQIGRASDRRFATERELVEVIRDVFASPESERWLWISELNSPSGIADLAVVKLAKGWEDSTGISRIAPRWAYALKCLPHSEPFRVDQFARASNVSASCASAVLDTYVQSEFCQFDGASWTKIKDPEPVADRIIAIEAKLRDWRKALYQACQYTDYATQSWVVLDRQMLEPAIVHLDEFERRGVGLAGISPSGEIDVVSHASSRLPRLPYRFWHANAEIARRLAHFRYWR